MIYQKEIQLKQYKRGYHLITSIIEDEIPKDINAGLLNILVKHTSAGITINENADADVRADFKSYIDHLIVEDHPLYTHTFEGSDDMPAHLKSSIIGASLNIPITNGRLNLGIWQGIYFCEFRNRGGQRNMILTIQY